MAKPCTAVNGINGQQTSSDRFYERALTIATESGIPFLVGGAFAFGRYTGIFRDTKDLDLFVRREDCERLMRAFGERGYRWELTFPHWLGKVHCGEHFVDMIFGSGNGLAVVDDEWFTHAVPEELWGVPVGLIPPEEMIWSKSFIMERERFDGADVAHVLRASADRLDWDRLLRRFDRHWRVLLGHLVLFGFIYPHEKSRIPGSVMRVLIERLAEESADPGTETVCQGTLLSREQYLTDIDVWSMPDARLSPRGNMSPTEVEHWTAAIDKK